MRWLIAGVGLLALSSPPASAETLLVVRKTDNALDFFDPGWQPCHACVAQPETTLRQ